MRLAAALWAELSTIYPEMTPPPFPPRDIVGDRAVFMLASIGSQAIGCGAVRPLSGGPEGVAEVKRMYVAPEARGRGVAAAILTALENWARTRSYERVQLETGERQPIAIRLYERFGYSRIPSYGHHAEDPLAICFGKSVATSGA